jgi:threonine 3-dehydrogenase
MTAKRALITGCGGQVGLELVQVLRERGWEVHGTDVVDRPAGATGAAGWHRMDVTDAASVDATVAAVAPDVVFHLAAILSSGGEKAPQQCYLVNQTGTWNLLEACRARKVPKLVFTSTIAAFGPGLPDPVPNEVSMRPTTMYGVTKVAGELLGEYYFAKGWLDFRCVRYPGLINAGKPGAGTSDYALFMYTDGIKLGRYEAFCRADTRIPFMYMPDATRALVEVADAPRERLGKRCTYNIQGFSPRADVIAASVEKAVPGTKITFAAVEWRQAILDSWPRALDDSAARRDWGWAPKYDLEGMTADLVPKIREKIRLGEL